MLSNVPGLLSSMVLASMICMNLPQRVGTATKSPRPRNTGDPKPNRVSKIEAAPLPPLEVTLLCRCTNVASRALVVDASRELAVMEELPSKSTGVGETVEYHNVTPKISEEACGLLTFQVIGDSSDLPQDLTSFHRGFYFSQIWHPKYRKTTGTTTASTTPNTTRLSDKHF